MSEIGGLHCGRGVNSTIFMKLHSVKVIIGMMYIMCERIFTGAERRILIVARSGGNLRKWYP